MKIGQQIGQTRITLGDFARNYKELGRIADRPDHSLPASADHPGVSSEVARGGTRGVTSSPEVARPSQTLAAAQYVRMSTDHQRYSTENQIAAIADYATAHGLQIVRTYADEGRSGLTLRRRLALQQLLADVDQGLANFETILVYDISRWGRFEDPDEAAHYEFLCRRAGIRVIYIAEQLPNDLTMSATLLKALKRAMAHEFSRELAMKVTAGKRRLAALGHWQGGAPGYGIRRLLVDDCGSPRGMLERGQSKASDTDRIVLVPGPDEEVREVRWMFGAYVDDGLSTPEIAAHLNARAVRPPRGKRWLAGSVRDILHSEKYAGTFVYGRTRAPMKSSQRRAPAETWVRVPGGAPAIVDRHTYDRAQIRLARGRMRFTEAELLERLTEIRVAEGTLSEAALRRASVPLSPTTVAKRFGTLQEAFARVGQPLRRPMASLATSREIAALRRRLEADLATAVTICGGTLAPFGGRGLMRADDGLTVRVWPLYCRQLKSGESVWRFQPRYADGADLVLMVRLNRDNASVRDMILVPSEILPGIHHVSECNGIWLDAFVVASLDQVATRFARNPVPVLP